MRKDRTPAVLESTTLAGAAVLVGALAVAATLSAWGAPRVPGRWPAVVFAATITGFGSVAGWLATRRAAQSPAAAVGGTLAATLLRLAPPLAGLAWLGAAGGDLRRAGADRLLVIFYLVLLATAIFLDIMVARPRPPRHPPTTPADSPPSPGV
jgi:hypothetical protein